MPRRRPVRPVPPACAEHRGRGSEAGPLTRGGRIPQGGDRRLHGLNPLSRRPGTAGRWPRTAAAHRSGSAAAIAAACRLADASEQAVRYPATARRTSGSSRPRRSQRAATSATLSQCRQRARSAAVSAGFAPSLMAAVTTVFGMVSLCVSENQSPQAAELGQTPRRVRCPVASAVVVATARPVTVVASPGRVSGSIDRGTR